MVIMWLLWYYWQSTLSSFVSLPSLFSPFPPSPPLSSQLVLLHAISDPIPRSVLDCIMKQQNLDGLFEWWDMHTHTHTHTRTDSWLYFNIIHWPHPSDTPIMFFIIKCVAYPFFSCCILWIFLTCYSLVRCHIHWLHPCTRPLCLLLINLSHTHTHIKGWTFAKTCFK